MKHDNHTDNINSKTLPTNCLSMKKATMLTAVAVAIGQAAMPVEAAPFDTCPTQAFLMQGVPVSTYGVNLLTGNYELLSDDPGINSNVNGVGFDEQDKYIYGYASSDKSIVRMGADFQAETLNVSGLPGKSFYVGDVANHHYYLYRVKEGFYKIDLSPLDSDSDAQLTMELINATASISITDMAFNPNDGMIYTVKNSDGKLYQIDPDSGTETYIGETGELGTFGAMYFDVRGYFYLSRNEDGKIYRIDLTGATSGSTVEALNALDVTAVHFADGPSSNQNDGARCASAPLIDPTLTSDIDFGDAPATYKTTLDDNGARHTLDGSTYLGLTAPDGDYDGYVGAQSDDATVINESSYDDEDGVNFVTSVETGLDTVVSVYASKAGILSAWFDWNRDGDFDDAGEQTLVDIELHAGANNIAFRVPDDAVSGNSWSRFRFSQQEGLNYYGGSTSGEVEDHAFTISESGISYRYYPSANSWVTLAYEDQWPATDDYDMNDVVMYYRTVEVIQNNKIVRIDILGELQALGGDYHSGFAVQLENVDTSNVNEQTLRLLHNNIEQQYSGTNGADTYSILESGNSNAVVVISQDLWKHADTVCKYHRTEKGCNQAQMFDFEISVPLIDPIALDTLAAPYDPFIFATEGLYHGDSIVSPGRALEVHLVDHAPTDKFNTEFFGLESDTSDPETGRYFRNENNLPWAIELPQGWKWPSERTPILLAYPEFQPYVESDGETHSNWSDLSQAHSKHLF